MKKILFTILLLIATPVWAQVVSTGAQRPEYGGGFGRANWAQSLGCVIQAYGTTSSFNSVQCYNPITNAWVALAQTNVALPHSRDNELWWYIENTKELMVWGGTNGVDSGRFNLSACAPTPSVDCAVLAYRQNPGDQIDTVQYVGATPGGSDSGMAWNSACDGGVGCGLIVGGNGAQASQAWIMERNTAAQITALGGTSHKYCSDGTGGAKLWIVCEYTGTKPPSRNQALGSVVAVGNDFYVGAGSVDSVTHRTDLWKFTRTGNAFSIVTPTYPGSALGSYQTSMTYDSDLNVIFFYLGESTTLGWVGWDIATASWIDATAAMALPCRFNQYAAYMPNVKKHFFSSGNSCGTGGASVAPPGLVTMVSPSGLYLSGKLYLAPGLWTFRPFSALPGGFPGKDSQSMKHGSWALNRANGRFYNFGGDWGVTDGHPLSNPSPSGLGETARNEIWSIDPVTHTAVLEFPYCGGTKGDVTVARPTELGAAWDGTQFWIMPGYMGQGNPTSFGDYRTGPPPDGNVYAWPCSITTQALPVNATLTFNPTTKKFSQPSITTPPCCGANELPKNGRYDSGNHSIWRIGTNSGGNLIEQYFIATNAWASYQMVCASDPLAQGVRQNCPAGFAQINSIKFGFEHFALDPVGRKIYVIDPTHFRLIIIDMASCLDGVSCAATIGPRPPNVNPAFIDCLGANETVTNTCPGLRTLSDYTQMHWDAVNGKVLYPFIPTAAPPAECNFSYSPPDCGAQDGLAGYPKLIVYDPVATTWSVDGSLTDTGARIRGNSFAFDPDNNFLFSIGGCVPNGCGDGSPSMTGYWLYRKGGTAPVNLTATLTVNHMNLGSGVAITVTPNDNNGAGNGTTSFTRTFTIANATPVTLTAPATVGTNPFSDWTGCDSRTTTSVANDTCHVVMASSKAVTAVYTTALVTRTLTITSSPTGIAMTILPLDNNSAGDCPATPCTRVYNNGANVTVTAPLTSGANNYTIWGGNCGSLNGRICSVTMSANKTVTAPYVTCAASWQNSVQFSNEQEQCGWSYRDSTGALMTFANGQWSGAEVPSGIGAGDLMHPGPTRTAVRRWTSPGTADLKITGNIRDVDSGGGDGVLVSIVKNGSTVLFGPSIIANGDVVGLNVDVTVSVTNGDTIDTIVAARANSDFDTTSADLLIAPVVVAPAVATVKFGSGGAAVSFGDGAKFGQ